MLDNTVGGTLETLRRLLKARRTVNGGIVAFFALPRRSRRKEDEDEIEDEDDWGEMDPGQPKASSIARRRTLIR